METLEQWGIILLIFILIAIFGKVISSKTKVFLNDPEWNNVFIGIIIGGILMAIFTWYMNKDDKPYDWCFYLDMGKSSHCVDLYDQATRVMQERSDYEYDQQGGVYPYGDPRMQ